MDKTKPCENCAACGGMRGLGPECAYWINRGK